MSNLGFVLDQLSTERAKNKALEEEIAKLKAQQGSVEQACPSGDQQPRVHLTLTIPQADALVAALEMYARLGLGQMECIAEAVQAGKIPIKKNSHAVRNRAETLRKIADTCDLLKGDLGFSLGESYEIRNPNVSESAHRACEIKKVVEKVLAHHPDLHTAYDDGLVMADLCSVTEVVTKEKSAEEVSEPGWYSVRATENDRYVSCVVLPGEDGLVMRLTGVYGDFSLCGRFVGPRNAPIYSEKVEG